MESRSRFLEYLITNSMADHLEIESRTGKLSCSSSEIFSFITDIRNFEQFIPKKSLQNWRASCDECSFQVPPFNKSAIRITEKIPYSSVVFSGNALMKDDFSLTTSISENASGCAEVKLLMTIEINPVFRKMVEEPLKSVLEKLISEMEKFENWNVKSI